MLWVFFCAQQQDHKKAIEWYTKSSETGYAYAAKELAKYYLIGQNIEKDFNKGMELLEMAIANNDIDALLLKAVFLLRENRSNDDTKIALEILELLVENNNPMAQYLLGMMYLHEDGIEKDFVKGIKLIKQSAENGFVKAQTELGRCYEEGIGVLKNVNDAIFWYRKASYQGDEYATERVEELEDY